MKSHSITALRILSALTVATICQPIRAEPASTSRAQAAIASAAKAKKYLFILFYKHENAATQTVRQALETALAKRADKATSLAVSATDPEEQSVVEEFGVSRSPMPLVIALAPNGAITGGFPLKLTEEDVAGAFVSPGMAKCLKGIQAHKLVLLCVQPAGDSDGLPEGVRDFKADSQYGPSTSVVTIRADDDSEAKLLKMFKLKTQSDLPVTAILVPPGRRLAAFEGAVTRDQLVEKLRSAQGGCCPGGKCGPGGCCPGGNCDSK